LGLAGAGKVRKERMIENADIFDFELSTDDMKQLGDLNEDKRIGFDPDNPNV
jgi:methylglyoxal/glyoxal reductase